uniref:Uncharacterized protein n=1 Tax=Anguilla anguilla TaxID=7936 RepID=A0A0E9PUF9_ANGAN
MTQMLEICPLFLFDYLIYTALFSPVLAV